MYIIKIKFWKNHNHKIYFKRILRHINLIFNFKINYLKRQKTGASIKT